MPEGNTSSVQTARSAFRRGYQPVPIRAGSKAPGVPAWVHLRWEDEDKLVEDFTQWAEQEDELSNVGIILGEPSRNLVDIDIDHPRAMRLREYFLPRTPMESGRAGRPRSHRWYIAEDFLPGTRKYKLPDGSVTIELRSTGAQTVIPDSVHPSGEVYRWEGEPWGGDEGPAKIDGRKLAIQVALLGLGAILIDQWPGRGGRHDAYLALAGGLLRYGDGVHPYWQRNLPVLIAGLAEATDDEDGGEQRQHEVMETTLARLRKGETAVGFSTLANIIGHEHADAARRQAREVESLGGFVAEAQEVQRIDHVERRSALPWETKEAQAEREREREREREADPVVESEEGEEDQDEEDEEPTTWAALDLDPYLTGRIEPPTPQLLQRSDGKYLMYPGRVNSLFGLSETAKSWIAIGACTQEIAKGERILYLDMEDEPSNTLYRLQAMGTAHDDIRNQFYYVRPEGPIADLQRTQWGYNTTIEGRKATEAFGSLLAQVDPTLIVVDGMTDLYGLHGHNTNEATGTSVVTTWLKRLTRQGRSAVIVIDHTQKSGNGGPTGSHHKTAMIQGSALKCVMVQRPRRGGVGVIKLMVHKDRPGSVREHSSTDPGGEEVAAVITIDSTTEGVTRMDLDPPEGTGVLITADQARQMRALTRREAVHEAVLAEFGDNEGIELTTRMVQELTGESATLIRNAWGALLEEGTILALGGTSNRTYRLNPDRKVNAEL